MKNFKKLMALVIAGAMVLGTMSFAGAADGDLNVNGALEVSGLDEGDTVDVYQILKWDPDNSIKVNNIPVGWVWGDNIDTSKTGITDDLLKTIIGTTDGSGKIDSTTAGILAASLKSNPVFNDAAVTGTGIGNAKWTGTVDKAGLYMAIVTPKTAGTMYNPVFVAANWYGDGEDPDTSNKFAVELNGKSYSNNGMAKKSTIPLDKTSEGTDENNNIKSVTGIVLENTSYTVDDNETVKFTVTSKVPAFGTNYTDPVFKFVDKLNGIGLVAESVEVKKADGTALPANSYEISDYEEGDDTFTVTFLANYLWGKTDPAIPADGQPIKITYSGTINGDVDKIVNQEDNTIDLIFSTEPDDEDGKGLLRDQTNHFTFSIDANILGHGGTEGSSTEAIKVGVDKEGKYIVDSHEYSWSKEWHGPLDGAEFALYDDLAEAKKDNGRKYTNRTFDGTVTTDAEGRLTITGLDAGTYYLKELSAPAGYIKLQDIVEVKIEAVIDEAVDVKEEVNNAGEKVKVTYKTNSLKRYTVTFKDLTTNATATTSYTIDLSESSALAIEADRVTPSSDFELKNTKGVELPSTGGMGTTLFYAIGAILVLGAGILLVSKRRMAAN